MIEFPGKEQALDPELSPLQRAYVRLLGVPVNGLRIRLRRVLPATAGQYRRILDAGCGVGVFTMELAKQHPEAEVVGIELEEALVNRANEIASSAGLANCRFECGDVTRLDLDDKVDLVLSVDNLEHVEDDVEALRRLHGALAADGRLVVHVPGYYRRWPVLGRRVNFDVPGHVRPGYRKEELAEKLERAGFIIERISYTYGFLETITNNISYLITGADRRNKEIYALVFPLLLGVSFLGKFERPKWGAGVLAIARPAD